ncbi:MAG: CPXCG motif-containing cysteine-rich protein, partial [Candidatus Methylomirabilales bacterium]
MSLLETVHFRCPYCGERIEVVVDCSIGFQKYVEDC